MRIKNIYRVFKAYGTIDVYRLMRDVLLTKFFYGWEIRKLRQPVYLLNKRQIIFGKEFTAGPNLRIEVLVKKNFSGEIINQKSTPTVKFGSMVKMNNNIHIGCAYGIEIGNNVLIGSNVLISDHDHGQYTNENNTSILKHPDERNIFGKKILIEDDVWIGENVCVLSGSKLGKGCVVGAMSLIKGQYPPYSLIIGTPGRVIKRFNVQTKKWEKT